MCVCVCVIIEYILVNSSVFVFQRNVSVQGLTEHCIIDCNEAVQLILAGESESEICAQFVC